MYSIGQLNTQESLTRTILSLESNFAKQNALQHVLNGLRIMYARDAVIAALSKCHTKIENLSGILKF